MEELSTIFTNGGRLLAAVAGGLSILTLCYAGIMWMTASGDPNKMGQARTAVLGSIGGLVIAGIAFIVPGIISRTIIEPAGGTSLSVDAGFDCDATLRQQLVFQRGASTSNNFNEIISQLQATRSECPTDVWNPLVADGAGDGLAAPATAAWHSDGTTADGRSRCFSASAVITTTGDPSNAAGMSVGDQKVPRRLRDKNDDNELVRAGSGRDSDNNVIVYWANSAARRSSDGAACWLYVDRLRSWSENY